MKKNEAENYIINKGFTRRAAKKIVAAALEEVEVSTESVDKALNAYINGAALPHGEDE